MVRQHGGGPWPEVWEKVVISLCLTSLSTLDSYAAHET